MSESTQPVTVDLDTLKFVPEVSFDIALGKKFDSIDFDYAAYDQHLRSSSLNPDVADTLAIRIRNAGLSTLGGGYGENFIAINLRKKDTDHVANNSLAHETQHFVDDQLGRFSKLDWETASLSMKAMRKGPRYTVYGAAINALCLYTENYDYSKISTSATALAMLSTIIGTSYYWKYSVVENSARSAETVPLNVITTQAK